MITDFIVTLIMVVALFYMWSFWNDEKFSLLKIRNVIFVVLTVVLTLCNYFIMNNFTKIVSMMIIFSLSYSMVFKRNAKESICYAFCSEIIIILFESIFSLIMFCLLGNNVDKYVNNYFGSIIANFIICFSTFLFSKFSFIKKFVNKANYYFQHLDNYLIFFFSILVILVYSLFAANVYNIIGSNIVLFISFIICIISIIFVFFFLKLKIDFYKMNNQYNSSLLSLKELEKVITNNRIDNHENKNQLMTIRNMTKNKKIISFIDSILNNDVKDDKRIMRETSIIPSGGLRGLIYSKILLMFQKNIEYELDVSNSIRLIDMYDIDDLLMLDVCKIIGIFLDNAIEEVETIDDKYIAIEMYTELDKIVITITNSYDNTKDKSNIYSPGVSTKGGNHGYGLSLVKKIVKTNSNLNTFNEISEEEFSQTLEIIK